MKCEVKCDKSRNFQDPNPSAAAQIPLFADSIALKYLLSAMELKLALRASRGLPGTGVALFCGLLKNVSETESFRGCLASRASSSVEPRETEVIVS